MRYLNIFLMILLASILFLACDDEPAVSYPDPDDYCKNQMGVTLVFAEVYYTDGVNDEITVTSYSCIYLQTDEDDPYDCPNKLDNDLLKETSTRILDNGAEFITCTYEK